MKDNMNNNDTNKYDIFRKYEQVYTCLLTIFINDPMPPRIRSKGVTPLVRQFIKQTNLFAKFQHQLIINMLVIKGTNHSDSQSNLNMQINFSIKAADIYIGYAILPTFTCCK